MLTDCAAISRDLAADRAAEGDARKSSAALLVSVVGLVLAAAAALGTGDQAYLSWRLAKAPVHQVHAHVEPTGSPARVKPQNGP